ncbi:MAG: MFS transporter [Bacteroidota bacterium]|nr:MFS transporter [Bacteroidota bacterium]
MERVEGSKAVLWSSDFVFACVANFLMGFSFYLLMPTLPFYLVDQFHAGKSLVGIVVSCYVIAALLIRPFSGYLVDSFSRKQVYLLSFLFFVAFYFGYLAAGSILFLAILRFLHGLTWGVITTAGNTLAIDVMPAEKRGRGIGFYGLALNISMAIGPVAGIFLFEHYSFILIFYTAIISGSVGLILAAFIKDRPRPKVHHAPLSFDRFLMVKGIPVGINLLMITISYGMVLSFAAMYGKETHATNPGLFYVLLAVGIGGSRVISGKLIDSGKVNRASMIGIILLAAGFAVFSIWKIPVVYYLSALVVGTGYGIAFPAFQTVFVNMAPHYQRGTANSTFYTAFDLGVGIGMLLAGKISAMANLSAAFGFSAVACLLSVVYYWEISAASYDKNRLE